VQEAVIVAIRLFWSDDAAIIVTVAPLAVVTTEGALRMTPFVADKLMVAPATDALPLVNAYNVSVNDDVPSALRVVELELIMSDATLKFAAAGELAAEAGGIAEESEPVNGVPALPPPPPQAAKANVSPNAAIHLMKFIRMIP
jgi:hypothetical protein